MAALTQRRGRAGLPPGVPRWPARAGLLAVAGAIVVSVVAAIVAATALVIAGADEQTGFSRLLFWALAVPGFLWVVVRVAGRSHPPGAAELGLRPLAPAVALRVLAAAVAGFAVFVALWSLVVDMGAALPVPAELTSDAILVARGADVDAVGLSANALALALALGVLAPLGIEILLRGFVLPALSSWRGTLPAVAIVSLLGMASGQSTGALLPCVAVLQLLLCGLYLLTGSLLPGIALSAGVSGLALGAACGWSVAGVLALAAGCALVASTLALAIAAVRR
jgi:membrane protease YdiL (CAAX protease family)